MSSCRATNAKQLAWRDEKLEALASELAATKAELERSRANAKMIAGAADRMRAHEKTQDAMLVDDDSGLPTVRRDATGNSIASALIAAWRAGK